jgi:hypothetical protein
MVIYGGISMQEYHDYRRKQIALITSLNFPSEKPPERKKKQKKSPAGRSDAMREQPGR